MLTVPNGGDTARIVRLLNIHCLNCLISKLYTSLEQSYVMENDNESQKKPGGFNANKKMGGKITACRLSS